MGRYLGSSCKYCRREGMKLMLKGNRCETAKWHTDYGVRLREKQKVKRYYGLSEKQFLRYFHNAERMKGNTGEVLLELLEKRLDNIIYKLNFAASRKDARQLIGHGHIYINGRRVDICGLTLKIGDKIALKDSGKSRSRVKAQLQSNPNFVTQGWLQLDPDKPSAVVVALPTRDDVQLVVEEHLIIEFCSK